MSAIFTIAISATSSQEAAAAAYKYFSQFFSGALDPAWPHAILLGVSILASVAVGIGIVLEAEKLKSLPTILVMAGVATEAICTLLLFGFDEGISRKQQEIIDGQQSKIIALEKRIAPRDLTPDQQAEIVVKLKKFSGTHFSLAFTQELEPMKLLNKIEPVLLDSGWIEDEPRPGEPHFNLGNNHFVGVKTVAGVWISYALPSEAQFKPAADALSEALVADDIVAPVKIWGRPESYDLDKIQVWVGAKP